MNHYDVLQVSPQASAEAIRAAYKSLMQRHHPDKNPQGNGDSAARIAQAYGVLGNPEKRSAYDRTLPTALPVSHPQPPPVMPRSPATAAWRARHAWMLVAFTLLVGGLVLQRQRPPQTTPSAPTLPPATYPGAATAAAPVPNNPVNPPDAEARSLPAFVTSLSIELPPLDPASPAHVLQIPTLDIRLAMAEPGRWRQKIEQQRPAIIRQLLGRLASAQYAELVLPDGGIYLAKLLESAIVDSVGLETAPATPDAPPLRPLEVQLPQAYSVR